MESGGEECYLPLRVPAGTELPLGCRQRRGGRKSRSQSNRCFVGGGEGLASFERAFCVLEASKLFQHLLLNLFDLFLNSSYLIQRSTKLLGLLLDLVHLAQDVSEFRMDFHQCMGTHFIGLPGA